MKLSKLITLAALVAIGPAFAADKHDHAHEHESMHGGLVVEVKDVDLELVAKPDVIQLHLRDHGPSHHLNRELFNSARLPEVVAAVRRVTAAAGEARVGVAHGQMSKEQLEAIVRAAAAAAQLQRLAVAIAQQGLLGRGGCHLVDSLGGGRCFGGRLG